MHSGSRVIDQAPPRDGSGGGGGWAWLLTAGGRIEAELVRGLLESDGIVPVWLDTRDPSPSAWLFPFGDPNALVRIYVPASLLEQARLSLLETGYTVPETPPSPQRSRTVWWIWIVVAVILGSIFLWATFHASVT